jgi:hypothetical protein
MASEVVFEEVGLMDECDEFVAPLRSVYEKWKAKDLIATLLSRDAEIERLKRRAAEMTLDDRVRGLIQEAIGRDG